jgi:hypothetical protein
MMPLDERKVAVCEKLPELIEIHGTEEFTEFWWKNRYSTQVHWPTEGLQVCYEARKLLNPDEQVQYLNILRNIIGKTKPKNKVGVAIVSDFDLCNASCEQQLETFCRIWFPERFKQ